MALSPSQQIRQSIAGRKRQNPDADVSDLDLELERARMDTHIDELVKSAPKMTPTQADRLRNLFAPLVKAVHTEGAESG